jgi:hypothetical protein
MHRVDVDEGGEYKGERYIWCRHSDGELILFEGKTTEELIEFLREHEAL